MTLCIIHNMISYNKFIILMNKRQPHYCTSTYVSDTIIYVSHIFLVLLFLNMQLELVTFTHCLQHTKLFFIKNIEVKTGFSFISKINGQVKTLLNTRINKLFISDPFFLLFMYTYVQFSHEMLLISRKFSSFQNNKNIRKNSSKLQRNKLLPF